MNVGASGRPAARISAQRLFEIRARVALGQLLEHRVVQRFHRAGDEQASGRLQHRQQVAMLQQMLDLDRDVVGQRPAIRGAAPPQSAWRGPGR